MSNFEDTLLEVGRSLHPLWPCYTPPHPLKNLRIRCLSLTFSLALDFCDIVRSCQAGKGPLENVEHCTQTEIVRPTVVQGGLAVQLKDAFQVVLEDLSSCQLSLIYFSSLKLLALCLHLRSCLVLYCGSTSLDIGRF